MPLSSIPVQSLRKCEESIISFQNIKDETDIVVFSKKDWKVRGNWNWEWSKTYEIYQYGRMTSKNIQKRVELMQNEKKCDLEEVPAFFIEITLRNSYSYD